MTTLVSSANDSSCRSAEKNKDHVIRQLVALHESKNSYDDDLLDHQEQVDSFFHQPHVVSAIALVVLVLLSMSWTQSATSTLAENTKTGILAATFFFIIVGILTFPTSGPFSKPLPILWRAVFAISVLYEVFLIILLFENKADARRLIGFLDPTAGTELIERSYAESCEFTWDNIAPNVFDRFALAHFIGWFLKMTIIRSSRLCWIISIGWEFIEILFTPYLPNFAECWWDQWLLDVMICNGLGILCGALVQHHFKMMRHNWFEVYSAPIYTDKTKKLLSTYGLSHLIQDKNLSESKNQTQAQKWGFSRSLKRFFGIQFIVLVVQIQELNAFFLKQLLYIPPESYLNPLRLLLWFFFSIPCVRQLYLYMTNPHVKTLGRQAFLSMVIMATELMLIFKLSDGEFDHIVYPDHLKKLIVILLTVYLVYNIVEIYKIWKNQPTDDVHASVLSKLDKRMARDQLDRLDVFDVMDRIHDSLDDEYWNVETQSNLHQHQNKHKKRLPEGQENSSFVPSTPSRSSVDRNTLIKFTPQRPLEPEPTTYQTQISSTSMVQNKDLFDSNDRFHAKSSATEALRTTSESERHRSFRMLLKQKREDGSKPPSMVRRPLARKAASTDDTGDDGHGTQQDEDTEQDQTSDSDRPEPELTPRKLAAKARATRLAARKADASDDGEDSEENVAMKRTASRRPSRSRHVA